MQEERIRHATEKFVNNLIDSVKKLIEANGKQINVLEVDRGYLNVSGIRNCDDAVLNGKYMCNILNGKDDGTYLVDVTSQGNGAFPTQIVKCIYGTGSSVTDITKVFFRFKTDKWYTYELATTSKTDILCTQCSGWTVTEQSSYIINNVVYINVVVRSETPMQIGVQQYPFTVPINYKPKASVVMCGLHLREGGAILINTHGVNGSLWNNGGFYFFNNIEGAQDIRFTGVYAI